MTIIILKGGVTKRASSSILVHTPNGCGWTDPKSGAPSVCHVGAEAQALGPISTAFLGALATSWTGSGAPGT